MKLVQGTNFQPKQSGKPKLPFATPYDLASQLDVHEYFAPVGEEGYDGMTQPEFADDCDINKIVEKHKRTGYDPYEARLAMAKYGDFSKIPDFQAMQELVIAAHDMFDALPAAVRKQFDNDPQKFLAAAETKEGRELMAKLGLGPDRVPETPAEASDRVSEEEKRKAAGGSPQTPAAPAAPTEKVGQGGKVGT